MTSNLTAADLPHFRDTVITSSLKWAISSLSLISTATARRSRGAPRAYAFPLDRLGVFNPPLAPLHPPGYDRCFLLMRDAMKRRSFLTTLGAVPALAAAAVPSSASRAPRKVIVGTVMQPFWVDHPGVTKRLSELGAIIDDMQAESRRKYRPRHRHCCLAGMCGDG